VCSEILRSAVSVELGDGEPCGSKGARVTEVLQTTEAPENGHVGTEAFPPRKRVGTIAQLKCIYTNAHSIGNKQNELGAIVQQENYDIVAMECCNGWLFRRDRQGRRGGRVALYVRECFDCLELDDGNEGQVFMGKNRGKANKADMVGVCYRPPNQDEEADEIFCKQLGEVSRLLPPCRGLQLTRSLLEIQYSGWETVQEVPGVCGR